MPRILFYELKKILSLPVLILLAVSVCILAGATLSRFGSFAMINGLSPREFKAMTTEYAGPLNQALADRALADWRSVPVDGYGSPLTDEGRARRAALRQLAEEYAACAGAAGGPEDGGDAAKHASPDAARRLEAALSALGRPAFAHGYCEGWKALLTALDGETPWLCAALVLFGLSQLFSGEAAGGMASLVRTTERGRQDLAAVKLVAAGLYGLACAALCALLPLALCAALYGLDGGELPAQYHMEKLAWPLPLAGYAALRAALLALGALALAAVTALLSSAIPSVTAPAIAGFALFLAPAVGAVARLDSLALEAMMRYFPSRLFLPGPLAESLQAAMLWQRPLWQSQWLALLWTALIPLLCAAAWLLYLRVPRQEPVNQE